MTQHASHDATPLASAAAVSQLARGQNPIPRLQPLSSQLQASSGQLAASSAGCQPAPALKLPSLPSVQILNALAVPHMRCHLNAYSWLLGAPGFAGASWRDCRH
ncbi:hypothetical protein COO60DRAFT_1461635 [Scenedesmus sp. NREL 46B-D3]|nr:hypothetical protein COO60DRAFT_1461635 [Scenedesmus sp. NREL 46B-D3]